MERRQHPDFNEIPRKQMPKWEERDVLFRAFFQNIYGHELNGEEMEDLRRCWVEGDAPQKAYTLSAVSIINYDIDHHIGAVVETRLSQLEAEEKVVVSLALGLQDRRIKTRDQIVLRINLAPERVNELIASATDKLRRPQDS